MKRSIRIAMIFMVVVLVFGLIGCQPQAAPSKGPITLNMLSMQQAGYPVEVMNEIIAAFNEANPNIKVEGSYVAYEALHDKISTAMATTPPAYDIVLVDDIWYSEFTNADYLLDITDRVTDEMRTGYFESGWDITRIDDHLYGLPWLLDAKFFFYNEKLLNEAGFTQPPATWEELADMSKVIKEKGIVEYPIVWAWAQAETSVCDLVALLTGNGGTLTDEKGNPTFNSPAGVEAVEWMVKTVEEGISNPASASYTEEDVRNVFSQGKAVFAINWAYMYQLANFDPAESQVNGQVNMALVPVFKKTLDQGTRSATINGSMGWSVAKNSPNAEAGWAFIKYLTSKEVQDKYSNYSMPAWQTSYAGDNLDKLISYTDANKVLIPMYVEQIPDANVRPRVPYYTEASLALQLALQNSLAKQMSPQQALDEAAVKFSELQSKYSK